MKFVFTPSGKKSLDQLPKKDAERILKKIIFWQKTDNPLSFAKRLSKSDGLFRFRLGNWRIIASPVFEKKLIEILKIGHRSVVYDS